MVGNIYIFIYFVTVIQTEDIEEPEGLPEYQVLDKENVILIQEVQDDVEEENAKPTPEEEEATHVDILMSLASVSETESEPAELLRLPKRSSRVKTRNNPN